MLFGVQTLSVANYTAKSWQVVEEVLQNGQATLLAANKKRRSHK